ncbi:MAG: hypothetical protein ABUL64_04030 [Singulisphaera sp.]
MGVLVYAADRPELPPFSMPERFRHEVAYFIDVSGSAEGRPVPQAGEYWLDLAQAQSWYDEGAILLVSPLDSENRTEVEISEEQEDWLAWVLANRVSHIRLV